MKGSIRKIVLSGSKASSPKRKAKPEPDLRKQAMINQMKMVNSPKHGKLALDFHAGNNDKILDQEMNLNSKKSPPNPSNAVAIPHKAMRTEFGDSTNSR